MIELTDTQATIIAFIIIVVTIGFIALAVFTIARSSKSGKEADDELKEYESYESTERYDTEIVETHGVITDMKCYTIAGGKGTQTARKFYILFTDDYGNEKEFYIDEESYLSLDTNISGTLGTLNGNFYGFCFDEESK